MVQLHLLPVCSHVVKFRFDQEPLLKAAEALEGLVCPGPVASLNAFDPGPGLQCFSIANALRSVFVGFCSARKTDCALRIFDKAAHLS
jgi:hypothetical protein